MGGGQVGVCIFWPWSVGSIRKEERSVRLESWQSGPRVAEVTDGRGRRGSSFRLLQRHLKFTSACRLPVSNLIGVVCWEKARLRNRYETVSCSVGRERTARKFYPAVLVEQTAFFC